MHYELTVQIDRPIEIVWDWVNDWFNIPRMRGQSLGFRQTSPGPVGLGATYEGRAMILGFETRLTGSITEWDPPHASDGTIHARPVRSFTVRETLYEANGGTRLVRTMDMELGPFFRLVWLFAGRYIVGQWRVATDNIKRLIESAPMDDKTLSAEPEAVPTTLAVRRTIMFTDIVGSTPLIDLIGDAAWRDLRRWHDATLRAGFERHHGRELDHAGDGFCVVFESAEDAVSCSIDIHRTFMEHRRSAGFAPQLRIGLHTGDLQRDGEGLTGSALHVASRIAASAEGGEILASSTTLTESGTTPASPTGEVSLRGVAEPISVAPIAW